MKKVGHGSLSLTRYVAPSFPQINIEVDVFQMENNELRFFYNPHPDSTHNFLTIEFQSSTPKVKTE